MEVCSSFGTTSCVEFEQWHSTKFRRALLLCLLGCSSHMLLIAIFAVLGFNISREKVLALEDAIL